MQLYDTWVGKKKEFVLKDPVRIFLCGPTVYDYPHLGHSRMLLFYDMMTRYFRSRNMRVSVIVNITDIDQKVYSKARAAAVPPGALVERFMKELLADISSLGIEGFALARVSDHAAISRELISDLLRRGSAYQAGGNVYLDTAGMRSLGMMAKMSKQDLDDCRLDISPAKKSQSDIMLWNASERFDIAFHDARLGDGIPWWHMQDSSVAMAGYAGSYDIHGGARELVYPHHESHLAQLQALTSVDRPVKFWTHVGLVRIKGNKMSKSLGNTIAIREILKTHSPNSLRLYFYSKHYRDDFDFSEKELERFDRIDAAIYIALQGEKDKSKMAGRFFKRIDDDFDTPGALKVLLEAAKARSSDFESMVSIFGLRY